MLYCKKAEVNRENMFKLRALPGAVFAYGAVDHVEPAPRAPQAVATRKLQDDRFFSTTSQAPAAIELKVIKYTVYIVCTV